jgi:hypothetical protein
MATPPRRHRDADEPDAGARIVHRLFGEGVIEAVIVLEARSCLVVGDEEEVAHRLVGLQELVCLALLGW